VARASETARRGGVSNIAKSKPRLRWATRASIRSDDRSSIGLAGRGPLLTTDRFGMPVGRMISDGSISELRYWLSPGAPDPSMPNNLACFGLRRSASTTTTFLPASANVIPRLETVDDLPSWARGLVKRIVLIFPGGEETSRVVRMDR
jgi:hypothetical protein